ncbi:hypothetical protein BKA69DRAFT_849303 [Paraphysoderma sedebokerense]|nr:hypothetical protein BKA69DRAFT_849303 [Paraphysoderma sedebokerense]
MFSVESPPSKDLLSKKTVVELRQICRDLKIQQAKIPKPVLIERILIHFGVAVEATEADRQPGEKRKSTTQKKSNSKKPKITNDSTSADGTLPMISTSAYSGPSPISSLSASLTATSVPIFTQAESAAGATSVLGSMEPVFSAIAAPVTSEPDASTSTNAIEPSSTVSKSDTLISSISFPEMNIPSGISSSQAAKSGFNSAAGVASVEDQSRKTLLDPNLCKKQNTNSNDTVGINIKDFNKRLPQKISSISASQTPISTVRKKQAVTSKMGTSTTKLTSLSKDKEGKSPITPTLFPAKDATAPANHKKFNVPLTSNGMPAFVSVISHPFSRPSVASTEPSKANVSKNLKTSTTKFTPAPRFIAPRPIKSASQVPNLPAEGNPKSCCSSRLSHPYPRLDCTISFPKLDHVLSDPLSEVLALVLAYLDISLVCQVECWSKISRISALHSYRHRLKLEFPDTRSTHVTSSC